ncbi:hypothetical protein ACOSQ3_005158 [Xanthoceras sorbifolium]
MSSYGGKIYAGGICRDSNKRWLGGFSLNREVGSVIEVELWGIYEGQKAVWGAGHWHIVLESDSLSAIKLLHQDNIDNHPLFNLILKEKKIWHHVIAFGVCNSLFNNFWHHVYFSSIIFLTKPPIIFRCTFSFFKSQSTIFDKFVRRQWDCVITHGFRESNCVTNGLAFLGKNMEAGIRYYEEPPLQIARLFLEDLCGIPTMRTASF